MTTKCKIVTVMVELSVPVDFGRETFNSIVASTIRQGFRNTVGDVQYIAVDHKPEVLFSCKKAVDPMTLEEIP